jgi:hypothetical protein
MTWDGLHGFLLPAKGTSGLLTLGIMMGPGRATMLSRLIGRAAFQENRRPVGGASTGLQNQDVVRHSIARTLYLAKLEANLST